MRAGEGGRKSRLRNFGEVPCAPPEMGAERPQLMVFFRATDGKGRRDLQERRRSEDLQLVFLLLHLVWPAEQMILDYQQM